MLHKQIFILLCISIIQFGYSQERPSIEISFDGQEWLENFNKNHSAELFNSPYSLNNDRPYYLWRETGIKNGALLFDGYSTYMVVEDIKLPEEFSLSFWAAPRAYDTAPDDKISAIIDHTDVSGKSGFRIGIYKHGTLVLEYGNGEEYISISNDEILLKKNEWNFVTISKTRDTFNLFLNGKKTAETNYSKEARKYKPAEGSLFVGRHKDASGFGEKFKFNMFSGLLDEVAFFPVALQESKIREVYKSISSKNIRIPSEEIRLDHTKYPNADYRPAYHAVAPAHWMNEPHAPFYFNGKYHLFYQHNPFGPYWGQIHWGHWVSDDMVNWEHAKIALAPEKGEIDPDGIWSGAAFVGPDGVPRLYYTAGNWSKEQDQYISIAEPEDLNDPNLQSWKKTGVIINEPEEYLKNEFRDPFIFQVKEKYYMIVGSGIENKGGSAPLFESDDAQNWEYLHPFYISDAEKYPFLGGVWELPVFLPINGGSEEGTQKYIFMVLPIRNEADIEVFYWIGEFDKEEKKFVTNDPEPKLIDYGDFGFTGPSGFVDPKTNRTIVFTIAQGKYGGLDTYDMGWAHNAGLPVELSLDKNDELIIKPIEEIKKLRGEEIISCQNCDLESVNEMLKNVEGDQLEILVEFENSDKQYGLEVRKSKKGTDKGMIFFDVDQNEVVFDKVNSQGEDQKAARAPIKLNGENLELNIFLDKSMIELYINNKVSITNRIYSEDKDAGGIELTGPSDLKIKNIQIWKMKGIDWKYVE